jgi:class 3 adenylate cyclase
MSDDQKLLAVTAALVVVLVLWAIRELVPVVRRRRRQEEVAEHWQGAAAELLPLLLQPVAAWVRKKGRANGSIEALVGPDGTVSLLFCDIEGSTEINRRLGDDAWVRVLREHDALVDRTVRTHGGQVVKTQGDGCMAAFGTPQGAVAAAVALGAGTRDLDDRSVPLALRVGVHTGAVVAEKGDLFGTEVAKAARIAATARGGEVLTSDAVHAHLRDDERFAFRKRRARRFKGLPGRHRVFAVTAA